jgi:hypothetical protein
MRKPYEKHTSKMHIYEIAKKRVQAQQFLACKPKYAIDYKASLCIIVLESPKVMITLIFTAFYSNARV